MLDFRDRSLLRRIMYAKPTIVLLGASVLLVAHGAWGMYQKSVEASANRNKAEQELSALKARESELQDDIAKLSTPRGQEEEIRDRFMVAKDGEKVIIVTVPESVATHTITVTEDQQPSFLDKLKAAVGITK